MLPLLRRIHTFLGCFFTPILLFFICTGWYQTMHPDRRKGPGEAEGFADRMRSVHADSLLPSPTAMGWETKPFRYFVAIMSIAFIVTALLGVILAFRLNRKKWPVTVALVLGVGLPLLLLFLGQKK